MSASLPTRKDPTFIGYNAQQASEYAKWRSGYPPQLIEYILYHHQKTGGQCHSVLDIGCGPGNSTRDLAPHFDYATGVDPSPEMTNAARKIGGDAKDAPIEYKTSDAEACEGIPPNSVDLITAAMSAHWFDMERFWPTAARVLKPNGTVAFFSIYRMFCHPSTRNAPKVQQILTELDFDTLKDFVLPGNMEVMNGYTGLQMPWLLKQKCDAFDKESYVRKVWNEGGKPSEDGTFFAGEKLETLEQVESSIGTSSAVTRWRDAHSDLARTEKDCVVSACAKIRSILGPDVKTMSMVGSTVLLLLKRKGR